MNKGMVVCLVVLYPMAATADIGLLLLESTGIGTARYTAAGHAAVYLSNLCAETPIHLRHCRAEESGAVISTYGSFGENRPYEWNVAPLRVFLYGSEEPSAMPLYGNDDVRRALRDRYRREYLSSVCSPNFCNSSSDRWGDMAAATLTRDIYCFRLQTTPEQDEALLAYLNSDPNNGVYHALTRNCADFTRKLINRVFPGAAQPDYLNDFFMTSPKAIAKSFVHYGEKHPDLGLSVERYSQIAGTIRRSEDNRKGTEASFRVKKWFLPLLAIRSRELPFFMAAYLLTGRFDAEREYRKYPNQQAAAMRANVAKFRRKDRAQELARVEAKLGLERDANLGNEEVWADYREQFAAVLHEEVQKGVFEKESDVKKYFKLLEGKGRADPAIAGMLVWRDRSARRVGFTKEMIFDRDSDQSSALRLMLAKVNATLQSKPKNRESLVEFRANWGLLSLARQLDLAARPHKLSEMGQ